MRLLQSPSHVSVCYFEFSELSWKYNVNGQKSYLVQKVADL
jgi:hypothetical protein